MLSFSILKKGKRKSYRAGVIKTAHGNIETPCFVPVGTRATVRGLTPQDLKDIGVQLLFGNTYHLHLRPGEDFIEKVGGLGKFMSWDGPTITDSGGFQVFSLNRKTTPNNTQNHAENESVVSRKVSLSSAQNTKRVIQVGQEDIFADLVKIDDNGVKFRSHIDGSLHMFTPEESIKIQKKLGADLILAFDECAPHPSSHEYTQKAMVRTHEWGLRSLKTAQSKQKYHSWQQGLYGIVQGGVYEDLRKESAKFIGKLPFDGLAIGGVAVGESKKEMRDALSWSVPYLPEEKPKHLLGIGEVDDIFDAVENGMDTFDCVIPTRFGRYGIVFVYPPEGNIKNRFRLDLTKSVNAKDQRPIAKDCDCYVCKNFSRAYLHHLFRSQELLAYRLASYHNVYFLVNLTHQIREAILGERFEELRDKWLK